jgi:hypothetical protein
VSLPDGAEYWHDVKRHRQRRLTWSKPKLHAVAASVSLEDQGVKVETKCGIEMPASRCRRGQKKVTCQNCKSWGLISYKSVMRQTYKVKDLRRHLLAGPMTFSYAKGEFEELLEALRDRDVAHIREEWNDVWFCLWGLIGQATPRVHGWTIPIGFGHSSCVKFDARIQVWAEICAHHEVEFKPSSLKAGSNFRKRTKVIRILKAHSVTEIDWAWVSGRVGGFEQE